MNDATQFFNTTAGGGYQIERSLRFNSADSAYLSRVPASAGNRKTYTLSFWVKRAKLGGSYQVIISNTDSSAINGLYCDFTADYFQFAEYGSSSFIWNLQTAAVYRDTSAWYHFVCAVDTTQATSSDRVKIWVNGLRVTAFYPGIETYPTLNYDTNFNTTALTAIGRFGSYPTQYYFDGYLADIHFIDGQALDPTSFGQFDANGVWQPKAYSGGYGTNGFHLPFSDNSTAAALGTDTSGNSNTWTVNNISVTPGSDNDSLVDTPTSYGTDTGAGGEVRGNYATLNPLAISTDRPLTLSNGNLEFTCPTTNERSYTTATLSIGEKTYWEMLVGTGNKQYTQMGIVPANEYNQSAGNVNLQNQSPDAVSWHMTTGVVYKSTSSVFTTTVPALGDLVSMAVDPANGNVYCWVNGIAQNSGNAVTTVDSSKVYIPAFLEVWNSQNNVVNFGQRPFAYTAPSGFKALCTTNLPDPVVAKPSEVMDVKLYTGNGSTQTISGLGFSPDLVWIKGRSLAYHHRLVDSVRGAQKLLFSSLTDAETTSTTNDRFTSFDSSGFTLGSADDTLQDGINQNLGTYVAWTWDAGSSTVTNNDGSISSQVRANPSAGFSIVTYTGNGGTGTVGHGLGVSPAMIIVKNRSSGVVNWAVAHAGLSSNRCLNLNTTDADTAVGFLGLNKTDFTSLTFTVNYSDTNTAVVNQVANDYIAYCFAPVEGYSAFGSYTGNGSADGPFVYTGMRPRWVLVKNADSVDSWWVNDSARDPYNVASNYLAPNLSNAEGSAALFDFCSNGFKVRTNLTSHNGSGNKIVYAAFAEHPFNTSRAR